MIAQETFTVGGVNFIRTYSDQNVMIYGGFPEGNYEEACDPADANRTYTETDIPIDAGEADAEEIVNILTGVSE